MPMPAHPAFLDCWHPQHERIIWHVVAHDSSSADEGIPPDGYPTHNGGISANGGPPSHQRPGIEMVTHDLRPWIDDIREYTRGATEDIIFQFHASID